MSDRLRRGTSRTSATTQFRPPEGSLYHEEVMGIHRFAGIQSLLYHLRPPTATDTLRPCGSPPGRLCTRTRPAPAAGRQPGGGRAEEGGTP